MDQIIKDGQVTVKDDSARKWKDELGIAKKYFDKWTEDGRKIIQRYRDEEKGTGVKSTRFNIFWASMEVMKPSVFSRPPKVECERRFKDADQVGRAAATLLERATDYSIEAHQDFIEVAKAARDDWLLPGRGVLWERYVPYMQIQAQISNDPESGDPQEQENGVETIAYEESITDYIFWQDFRHNPTRNWNEVRWVARRAYMTKEELLERFDPTGEKKFDDVPLDFVPLDIQNDRQRSDLEKDAFKKAAIWEIWDKVTKKVYWVSEQYDRVLDEQNDPLKLKDFFPCARPLYATLTSDTLVPRAFFSMAEHQANEIDKLTERISVLTEALRCVGVCPPDAPELLRAFQVDNTLIPIPNWNTFASRGGFDGILQWLPIDNVVKVLAELYEAREAALQKYYEVTGWSDIVRGATDPRETATAQGLKSQYASKRIQEKQEDMQRFLRDQIRIKAEIIAEHFQPETLRLMTGVDLQPGAAEVFEQAVALIRQDTMRCFRIDIETDSTIALDENLEKEKRSEYLEAVTGFIGSALPVIKETPELLPFAGEALMFLSRGFKAGRQMEGVLESCIAAISQSAQQQAENPQPDPEMMKIQAQQQSEQVRAQSDQVKMQMEQGKAQVQVQMDAAKFQLEQQKLALEMEMKQTELALKNKEIELKALTEERKAKIKAETDLQIKSEEIRFQALQMSAEATGSESGSSGGSKKSPPINITIAQPRRRAVFSYDGDGNRVAEVSDVEDDG